MSQRSRDLAKLRSYGLHTLDASSIRFARDLCIWAVQFHARYKGTLDPFWRSKAIIEWGSAEAGSVWTDDSACSFAGTISFLLGLKYCKFKVANGVSFRFNFVSFSGQMSLSSDETVIERFKAIDSLFENKELTSLFVNSLGLSLFSKQRFEHSEPLMELGKTIWKSIRRECTELPLCEFRSIPVQLSQVVVRRDVNIREIDKLDQGAFINSENARFEISRRKLTSDYHRLRKSYPQYPEFESVNPSGHGFFE